MVTFQWLVGNFLENLLVVLVVVFHSEIRRGLARIGQWRLFGGEGSAPDPDVIDQIAQSAFLLAGERTGAILLLEREMGLEELVEHGKKLDALFSHELAASIFATSSPVHDGAVVIRRNRIAAAGVILPIPAESVETRGWAPGTGRRSASRRKRTRWRWSSPKRRGTSRSSRAARRTAPKPCSSCGTRSGCCSAWRRPPVNAADLFRLLRRLASQNLGLKVVALALAVGAWWFVAGESKVLVSFTVPLEMRNVPKG